MKKTVLIAGASVGWGHMQAAINVADALAQIRSDLCIETINIFDYFPKGLRYLYEDGWRFASSHFDWMYGNLYRGLMSRTCSQQTAEMLMQRAAQRLAQDFKHQEVVIYVATQGMAASAGSLLKNLYQCKLCVVATDFVLQSLQVFPNVDSYYLPPGCQMAVGLSAAENLKGKTLITGIPIAMEFAREKDKEALRKSFGLSNNLATILVSFGGAGLKAQKHVQLFEDLLDLGLPLQFIVLAGQNTRFAKMMRDRYGNSKYRDRIKVHDYLNNVSAFYAVADLFIGKAGGLTISESLASNLPIAIVDMLPGQEEFNMNVISSQGLGHHTRNSVELGSWIESSLSNGTSASWKSKLGDFAKPNSSMEVASHIASLTE